MRIMIFAALLWGGSFFGQKPCDFNVDVTDSLGRYTSTREYLLYERSFAENASYIFASIVIANGTPVLEVQFLEKSADFIKARCFDKNSRIYFQLASGKIVTLIQTDEESCGTMVRDEKGLNNRVTTGFFLFRKDDYEGLKSSPVSLMRIRFATDTTDYIFRREFKAELDGQMYDPEDYFINYFHCLAGKD